MIYVSSSCVKVASIKQSVTLLAEEGIGNIELSGGTKYYSDFEHDLLFLQDKYDLNYTVHNYFPPPVEPFILNLATLDEKLYQQSLEHCQKALALCKKLGSKKYGVHAGFLIDFPPREAGKKIALRTLNDRKVALRRFSDAWARLNDQSGPDVALYLENNVFSQSNAKTYSGNNPFLMTDHEGYLELMEEADFTILLDLAHLKVSAQSLNLNFQEQARQLLPLTDYLHVSGNDGLHDQNLSVHIDGETVSALTEADLSNKTITLEVYSGMGDILESYEAVEGLLRSSS